MQPSPPAGYYQLGAFSSAVGQHSAVLTCRNGTDAGAAATAQPSLTYLPVTLTVTGPAPPAPTVAPTVVTRGGNVTVSAACPLDAARTELAMPYVTFSSSYYGEPSWFPYGQTFQTVNSDGSISRTFAIPADAPTGSAWTRVLCFYANSSDNTDFWQVNTTQAFFTVQ
jgi:hypothetical protein